MRGTSDSKIRAAEKQDYFLAIYQGAFYHLERMKPVKYANIAIPEDLRDEAKVAAAEDRQSIKDWVAALIRKAIDKRKRARPA